MASGIGMIGAYTCLFGPYDDVAPAKFGGVLFTDQDVRPGGWQVRKIERPLDDANLSSRFYFCQSCRVMPDYAVTVEHGANMQLRVSPEELVESYLSDDYDIACYAHPHRDNVYDEGEACIRLRKDKPGPIRQQMERYRREGFPGDGLSACTLLIRRNTAWVAEFEDLWWHEIQNGSRRNQLSFDYCRWRLGLDVARIPGSPFDGTLMIARQHTMQVRYG